MPTAKVELLLAEITASFEKCLSGFAHLDPDFLPGKNCSKQLSDSMGTTGEQQFSNLATDSQSD